MNENEKDNNLMSMTMSAPFLSADRRTIYVTMSNGQRRRMEQSSPDGELVFYERSSKAERKVAKRLRHRAAK